MKQMISLQIDEEVLSKLDEICKLYDRSRSYLCRMAIVKYVEQTAAEIENMTNK